MKNKFLMFSKTELAEYLLAIDNKSNNSLFTSRHFDKMAHLKLKKISQLISENLKESEIIYQSKDMDKFERATRFYSLDKQYHSLNNEYNKWSKMAFKNSN